MSWMWVRAGVACLLLLGLLAPSAALAQRSIDGTGNHATDLGAAGDNLIRLTPAGYGDGISTPAGAGRPGARAVSNGIADQTGSMPSSAGLSDMFWIWGQFLDHDIDLTHTSAADPHAIPVPQGDPYFDLGNTGTQTLPFNRSVYDAATGTGIGNPRQQINDITSFIDGSVVYGSDATRAGFLRANDGTGRLATSAGDLLPFNTGGFENANEGPLPGTSLFLAGDIRANENVALTSMHTIFAREHNRIADALNLADPGLDGDAVYEAARAEVGALLQAVTYNEFLPVLLGPGALGTYSGHDPAVDPRISVEFSTAAYRFGHSLLGDTLLRLDPDGTPAAEGDLALANAFFNPGQITSHGIDSVLQGAAAHAAQELDPHVVGAVRNFLFGPPGSGGMDLASLNIQRGRDHGLLGFNDTRLALGLSAFADFSDITSDPVLAAALAATYADVDDVDLWVGGLAEDVSGSGLLGETLTAILVDQFLRLRDGDAYWYELQFSGAKLAELNATTLADVIERNSGVTGLQANVFFTPEPTTLLLLAGGLAGLAVAGRRRSS